MLRRPALVALAIALVVPLAACTEATRIPDAEPSSELAPLFASDEEALAAATAAYEEFLAVLDAALEEPSIEKADLERVSGGQALSSASESIRQFSDEGLRISGPRAIGSAQLQQHSSDQDGAEVTAYFCEDITDVLLLDADGASLTQPDRPDYSVFEATIEFTNYGGRVVERDFWSNESSC